MYAATPAAGRPGNAPGREGEGWSGQTRAEDAEVPKIPENPSEKAEDFGDGSSDRKELMHVIDNGRFRSMPF